MQAFRLTEQMKREGFSGGSIAYDTLGHMLDIGEELSKGNGVIVTDNSHIASVLASYPALEPVPEDETPQDVEMVEFVVPSYLQSGTIGPAQVQTNDIPVGAAAPMGPAPVAEESHVAPGPSVQLHNSYLVNAPTGEVPVEHADEGATAEDVVAQGEAVSGNLPEGEDSHDEQDQDH